ncbi:uncharacterized protein LOC118347922 [Juglans regia]|uniref:Uncharacterized protein LOC118347922 n=1 Tax=Juglans regia TaxID=51240 RepID=A0A6P9EJA4_JUGRE|nr:uncharacterized protein LOC118347922 [Juglans regia]
MNKSIGERIGGTIGKVVEVDVREDGLGWGSFLRVRVECDLRKVMARGRTLNLQGKNMWVSFTYEKLPRMCFRCDHILHSPQGCTGEATEAGGQFGPWLRASQFKFKRSEGSKVRMEAESIGDDSQEETHSVTEKEVRLNREISRKTEGGDSGVEAVNEDSQGVVEGENSNKEKNENQDAVLIIIKGEALGIEEGMGSQFVGGVTMGIQSAKGDLANHPKERTLRRGQWKRGQGKR